MECKDKYFHADLLDLNNKEELKKIFEYLANNAMTDFLRKVHVRIKLSSSQNEPTTESDEKRFQFDENNSSENTLKLKLCKPIKKTDDRISESTNEFEASFSNEEVITFFNSKLQLTRPQCFSISIINNFLLNKKNNFTYCIELKECNKNLPFICKYELNKTNYNYTKTAMDVYPDTLQGYQQDPKMSYVINSFLAVVHGLEKAHKKVIVLEIYLFLKKFKTSRFSIVMEVAFANE